MATIPLKNFPLFLDDTRLVRHLHTLYKVKVIYPESNIHKIVHVTEAEAHSEIEGVFRAVLYMSERDIALQTVITKHFLIIPRLLPWSLSSVLVFTQEDRVLKAHPFMVELVVKSKPESSAEVSVLVHSSVADRKGTEETAPRESTGKKGSQKSDQKDQKDVDHSDCVVVETDDTYRPRFKRGKDGRLCWVVGEKSEPERKKKVQNLKDMDLSELRKQNSGTALPDLPLSSMKKVEQKVRGDQARRSERIKNKDMPEEQSPDKKKIKTSELPGSRSSRKSVRQLKILKTPKTPPHQSNASKHSRKSFARFKEKTGKTGKGSEKKIQVIASPAKKKRRKFKLYTTHTHPKTPVSANTRSATKKVTREGSKLSRFQSRSHVTDSISSPQVSHVRPVKRVCLEESLHYTRGTSSPTSHSVSLALHNRNDNSNDLSQLARSGVENSEDLSPVTRSQARTRQQNRTEIDAEMRRVENMQPSDVVDMSVIVPRDRYLVEMMEREETDKLRQLCQPSGSCPVTRKRSGVWNLMDNFVSPVKRLFKRKSIE